MNPQSLRSRIDLLKSRRSVRAYSDRPVDASALNALKAEVSDANSHGIGLHFQLVTGDPAPFRGFRRSYGMLSGVRNYLAVVYDASFPEVEEEAGYYAEQFVIKATELGLGTCYVGGTFSRADVHLQMRVDWKLRCLVAFGYADEKRTPVVAKLGKWMVHRHGMSPEDFYAGPVPLAEARKLCPDLEAVLKAIACAPSALNKRPVRLSLRQSQEEPESAGLCRPLDWVDAGDGWRLELSVPSEADLFELGIARYNADFPFL